MANLQDLQISDSGFLQIPIGPADNRPSANSKAYLRYNTDRNIVESLENNEWQRKGQKKESIVKKGLEFAFDAGNPDSYPGSGNVVYDISGNEHNGTMLNNTFWSAENQGTFVFDGSADVIVFPTAGQTDILQSLSICFWAFNDDESYDFVFHKSPGEKIFIDIGTGEFRTQLRDSAGSDIFDDRVSPNPYNGQNWAFYAVTWTGSSYELYINGIARKSGTNTAGRSIGEGDGAVQIGNQGVSGARPYSGKIANCFVYNRSISQDEVRQMYDVLKWRYTSNG